MNMSGIQSVDNRVRGVYGLILTFNRVSSLRSCLNAVQNQTKRPETILIVNNASSDDTPEFLEEQAKQDSSITIVNLPENLGPAGAYAFGLKWGSDRNFSYCWVMDDDVFPNSDCLEFLLEEMETDSNKIIFPLISSWKGEIQNYPAWAGLLIPIAVVKRAGLPRQELFWWAEDTEYLQWRLPKIYGIHRINSKKAMARHGVYDGKEKPAWKYYYEVRNTIYYRFFIQKGNLLRRIRRTIIVICKFLLRVLFKEGEKLLKIRLICLGVWDGIRGQLGKKIDPVLGPMR